MPTVRCSGRLLGEGVSAGGGCLGVWLQCQEGNLHNKIRTCVGLVCRIKIIILQLRFLDKLRGFSLENT